MNKDKIDIWDCLKIIKRKKWVIIFIFVSAIIIGAIVDTRIFNVIIYGIIGFMASIGAAFIKIDIPAIYRLFHNSFKLAFLIIILLFITSSFVIYYNHKKLVKLELKTENTAFIAEPKKTSEEFDIQAYQSKKEEMEEKVKTKESTEGNRGFLVKDGKSTYKGEAGLK